MEKEPPFKLIMPFGVFCQIVDLLVNEQLKQREYKLNIRVDDRTAAFDLPGLNLIVFGVPDQEEGT